MDLDPQSTCILSVLVFLVAALYSSVGHGGASGYLAVMTWFALGADQMSSQALVLNVLVASIALASYVKAGQFRLSITWPFVALSMPCAFLGGLLKVDYAVYALMLALVLIVAAWRLWLPAGDKGDDAGTVYKSLDLQVALPAGAFIGFVSGVVGVGGGIFLSPILILAGLSSPRQSAAASAAFIVANSLAALAGRFARCGIAIGDMWVLVAVAGCGGLAGSQIGARKLSGAALRRFLAVVLLMAALKLLVKIHY